MERSQLAVHRAYELPLREISGLGQRVAPARGARQLVAVGDEEFTIVLADLEEPASISNVERFRLDDVVRKGPSGGSQWEAADGDATGRIFVLEEAPPSVFVFGPNVGGLLQTIDLSFEAAGALEPRWRSSANVQGEGLVLLRDGHLLIAKEKDPPVLMELGPAEDRARGTTACELVFPSSAEFPAPDGRQSKFHLLEVWDLDTGEWGEITDISDIAVGPDERLYLVSDESHCIARLETDVAPSEARFSVTMVWSLPEDLRQPEGLVFTQDLTPIVAVDRKEPTENVFVLEPLRLSAARS